jgi:hypothetical protein
MKQGYDMVIVARSRCFDGPYNKLSAAYDKAVDQLGLFLTEEER